MEQFYAGLFVNSCSEMVTVSPINVVVIFMDTELNLYNRFKRRSYRTDKSFAVKSGRHKICADRFFISTVPFS